MSSIQINNIPISLSRYCEQQDGGGRVCARAAVPARLHGAQVRRGAVQLADRPRGDRRLHQRPHGQRVECDDL